MLFAVLVFFSALSFLDADFFTADFFAGDFLSDVFETLRVLFAAVVLVSVINGLVSCSAWYLQADMLKDCGINHFDEWAADFGEVKTDYEHISLCSKGMNFKLCK